jgi:sulfur carrier protein
MSLKLNINGQSERVDAKTVASLLDSRGIDRGARGLAVAVNGAVVPRRSWEDARLSDGDAVEIVKPFSGG